MSGRNITLRLSDGDYHTLVKLAESEHTSPTSYLRELLIQAKQRSQTPELAAELAQALAPSLAAMEERMRSQCAQLPQEIARVLTAAAKQQQRPIIKE